MIDYLKGTITALTPSAVVVDINGIGYFVKISLPTFSGLKENTEGKLFIHEIIREDTYDLYGFLNVAEREVFRQLISVSGIGANTARLILSSLSVSELQNAIATGAVDVIKQIKGIGLKTAQRLIVDLKDKIGLSDGNESNFLTSSNNRIKEESLSALIALGFTKKQVEKMIDKVLKDSPEMGVEEVIKIVLKGL
jgi:Holliday junction DNA helicase RuvA